MHPPLRRARGVWALSRLIPHRSVSVPHRFAESEIEAPRRKDKRASLWRRRRGRRMRSHVSRKKKTPPVPRPHRRRRVAADPASAPPAGSRDAPVSSGARGRTRSRTPPVPKGRSCAPSRPPRSRSPRASSRTRGSTIAISKTRRVAPRRTPRSSRVATDVARAPTRSPTRDARHAPPPCAARLRPDRCGARES